MNSPAISVVIPTYKHRDFVLATLASVSAQTYKDYEIIVVNDGSPDDTASLLEPHICGGQIRYIEQANKGQAAARNRGLSESRGEYVAFLDDDDYWPPDKLAWQIDLYREVKDAVLVYGYVKLVGRIPEVTYPGPFGPEGDVSELATYTGWIRSPGQTLIPRCALLKIGGFDERIWGTDDWDLYIRLSRIGRFVYRNRLALNYRCHQQNASANYRRMYENGMKVRNKHFGRWPLHSPFRNWLRTTRFVQRFCSGDAIDAADRCASGGQRGRAMRCLVDAVTMNPKLIFNRGLLRRAAKLTVKG